MPRITFRLIVAALAFAIGIVSIWLAGLYPKIEDFLVDRLSAPLKLDLRPQFEPTERSCGPDGYTQSYTLPDGREMSEASYCPKPFYPLNVNQEVQAMVANASRVVERVPTSKNRYGKLGERIVLEFSPDSSGKDSASIIWFDGNCMLEINAPSLEIALEFEKANAYAY